ncbi:hypothetical protein GV51_0659 [Gardnerella vaginalis 5-1]|nr:hypothetical protein GV51_0659 [Gardnerella vaginalis 5-1]
MLAVFAAVFDFVAVALIAIICFLDFILIIFASISALVFLTR